MQFLVFNLIIAFKFGKNNSSKKSTKKLQKIIPKHKV